MAWQFVGALLGVIVLLGAAVKALPVVWGFVKGAAKVPVILDEIVKEFGTDNGSTMRDSIDRLEVKADETTVWQETHAIEDLAQHAETAAEMAQQTEYVHKRMHDLLNRLTPLLGFLPLLSKRFDRVEEQLAAAEAERLARRAAEQKEDNQ